LRQYLRQSTAADVLLPLPNDLPVASATAILYGPDGDADWDPAETITHPAWALNAEAAADATSFVVTSWSTHRVPLPGEELTLSAASSPAAAPTESVVVDRVESTTVYLRDPLRLTWAASAVVQPRVMRVPLDTDDTATTGRTYRVEATVTLHSSVSANERTVYPSAIVDVVKHVPQCTLTLARLRDLYPNLFGRLSGDLSAESSDVEILRTRCWELVVNDVSRKIKPDHLYSDNDLEPPTVARMLLEMARDGRLYPEDTDRKGVVEDARGHYARTLSDALSSMGWVDVDEDQEPDDGETGQSALPRVILDL